jgi:hypothetical protein
MLSVYGGCRLDYELDDSDSDFDNFEERLDEVYEFEVKLRIPVHDRYM